MATVWRRGNDYHGGGLLAWINVQRIKVAGNSQPLVEYPGYSCLSGHDMMVVKSTKTRNSPMV